MAKTPVLGHISRTQHYHSSPHNAPSGRYSRLNQSPIHLGNQQIQPSLNGQQKRAELARGRLEAKLAQKRMEKAPLSKGDGFSQEIKLAAGLDVVARIENVVRSLLG